jgi:pimeloyl-ACP methyl ester carboxylesterase
MVIFPGLSDAVWDVTTRGWVWPVHPERLGPEFSIYAVSRKRGLPIGYTTADMAADYAKALDQEIGPAIIVGISLGGHIAQHFAANFPQLVDRLVIVSSADRVSQEGRIAPERWLQLAHQNRWREFLADIFRVTRQEYQRTCRQFLIPIVRLNIPNPRDFLVSLEASLAHDGSNLLDRIHAPTLVVGGSADIYFPPPRLHEMAKRIAHATLHLIEGGHAAYEIHKDEFETVLLDFLQGRAPASAPTPAPVTVSTSLVTT